VCGVKAKFPKDLKIRDSVISRKFATFDNFLNFALSILFHSTRNSQLCVQKCSEFCGNGAKRHPSFISM